MAEQYYATGKRKTAVARVWLKSGKGEYNVNKLSFEDYFGAAIDKGKTSKPFMLTDTVGNYDVFATLKGGGKSAQSEALRHGIAKALLEVNPEYRTSLKKAGMLTRDSRVKERKKYGQKGARARFQFSKR
ncbi:MAG: 30S ribosomal protein S9 [Deltaproteobacteria bacterium]|jgi:small subunit ribosomal protein S9|nr:30S ribosomal protein S9 [Deltaproteobacteria bacterium]NOR11424.1 30S ribosomal protein S9 [Desulfovibrionaceae bacterium]